MELVTRDLHQSERAVPVEALLRHVRFVNPVAPQLGRRADDEVVTPALRLHSFVEVLVSREHEIHSMLYKKRLEQRAQLERWTVLLAGRVRRMVKERDLPVAS